MDTLGSPARSIGPMLIYIFVCMLWRAIKNNYYTVLSYRYLLLEYEYLAHVLLKIMNTICVNFYDNKWAVPGAYDGVKTALHMWDIYQRNIEYQSV
jgi:hypothetical protein